MNDRTRSIGIVTLMLRSMREFAPTEDQKETAVAHAVDLAERFISGVMGLSISESLLDQLQSSAFALWDIYVAQTAKLPNGEIP